MNTLGQSKTENFGALDQLVEQVQQWSIDKTYTMVIQIDKHLNSMKKRVK